MIVVRLFVASERYPGGLDGAYLFKAHSTSFGESPFGWVHYSDMALRFESQRHYRKMVGKIIADSLRDKVRFRRLVKKVVR